MNRAYFFSGSMADAVRGQRTSMGEQIAQDRLERFRWLLGRYEHVWHFKPPKDIFIKLWHASETVESAQAEGQRLNGE